MDAPAPILQFEHVDVSFDDNHVLKDVSFSVVQGETVIVLGAAGSGKTVMLKTAMGLLMPTSGHVRLFGEDLQNLSEEQLFSIRGRIGMLFQESALFDSMSIEQNVAYPLLNRRAGNGNGTSETAPPSLEELRQKVREALHFVELDQTLKQLPSELSGGMRRRAAIARAVVTDPPLLLYDSPTAGLDPITAHTIVALIIKERDVENTTALIVTHRYQDGSLVANFRYNPENGQLDAAQPGTTNTRFLVMREGSLIFEGDQNALEASTDSYIQKFVKKTN